MISSFFSSVSFFCFSASSFFLFQVYHSKFLFQWHHLIQVQQHLLIPDLKRLLHPFVFLFFFSLLLFFSFNFFAEMKVLVSYSWHSHLFLKFFVPIFSYLTVNCVFPNLTYFGLANLLIIFVRPRLVLWWSMFLKNKWLALEATLLENYFLLFSGFVMLVSFRDVLDFKFL